MTTSTNQFGHPGTAETIGSQDKPTEFAVTVEYWDGQKGKATLSVSSVEIKYLQQAGGLVSAINRVGGKLEYRPIAHAWKDLRELEDMVLEQGWFRVNTGVKDKSSLGKNPTLKFTLQNRADWPIMAEILKSTPAETRAGRCLACLGPIIDGVCRSCGASGSASRSSRRFGKVITGIGVVCFGIVLLTGGVSQAWWLIVIGLLYVGYGAFGQA